MSTSQSDHIMSLSQLNEEDYFNQIVKVYGYDPKKEIRINKLEKMCKLLSSPTTHVDGITRKPIDKEGINFFYNLLNDCRPIMFKMTEDMRDLTIDSTLEEYRLPIDIPFKTFSIETADDWHSLFTLKGDIGLLNATMVVIHELAPDKLVMYVSMNFIPNNHGKVLEFVERRYFNFNKDELIYHSLALYMSKLDNRTAKVEYRVRSKIKVNGEKKLLKIKTNAIYIDPSRKYYDKEFNGKNIEWTHSWEVRGHWRRLNGIGRDREGIKNTEGWTWINPYVKGDGELIKKDRVVK